MPPTTVQGGAHPQILATCRQIHKDATNLLYAMNWLAVEVHRKAIRWHGMEYRGSGAISIFLPHLNRPRPRDRPSFYPLQMAESLFIRVTHELHPSLNQLSQPLILSRSRESNWVYQLRSNLEWLVERTGMKENQLKRLEIQLDLDYGQLGHADHIASVEKVLLSVLERMRGVGRVNMGVVLQENTNYAYNICFLMVDPPIVKYVSSCRSL